jgi:hypothetical protein
VERDLHGLARGERGVAAAALLLLFRGGGGGAGGCGARLDVLVDADATLARACLLFWLLEIEVER